MAISVSKVVTPRSIALSIAAIVFSGIKPRQPRWPCLSNAGICFVEFVCIETGGVQLMKKKTATSIQLFFMKQFLFSAFHFCSYFLCICVSLIKVLNNTVVV